MRLVTGTKKKKKKVAIATVLKFTDELSQVYLSPSRAQAVESSQGQDRALKLAFEPISEHFGSKELFNPRQILSFLSLSPCTMLRIYAIAQALR